ncbi:MAG: hypothetical protein KKD18_05570 [Nanoarchaeota archaeon]|nr:hypothetical protein [Nanoarchaeota archaeon]
MKVKEKYYQIRFSETAPPTPITIGENSILLTLWGKEPLCIEIRSSRMVEKYSNYFYDAWKLAKA